MVRVECRSVVEETYFTEAAVRGWDLRRIFCQCRICRLCAISHFLFRRLLDRQNQGIHFEILIWRQIQKETCANFWLGVISLVCFAEKGNLERNFHERLERLESRQISRRRNVRICQRNEISCFFRRKIKFGKKWSQAAAVLRFKTNSCSADVCKNIACAWSFS